MLILDQIHAAVSFGKKFFRSTAVDGMERTSDADGDDELAADGMAGFMYGAAQPLFQLLYDVNGNFGEDKYEFITPEPADLVVFAARGFEASGNFLEKLVSRQMTKLVVNLLEPVEVAKDHGQWSFGTPDALEFFVKMGADGAGIGQAGEEISAGSTLRLFELNGILDRDTELGTCGEEHAEMLLREIILVAMIKRENPGNAIAATERDTESRLNGGNARGHAEVMRFRRRIAIGDGFFVAGNPSGETLAHGNAQG